MNIKEAKQEILDTVDAYLRKDASGAYEIPPERQRPILLIGPPGIGKTAIMEQAARERGINLVSYTITHHTRQSAIGLPFISKRMFNGTEYSVTEYTMSEIVASVYEQIERSGIREGILFLDEINCVSETLAPTMLQFLQYKTFGVHKIPDGFLIVTAGNPPQYNKSVRDFDIVTLDRVKRIDVTEDFECWKEYAYKMMIHGSILAYLEIRRENFYSIRTDLDGRRFVTARGWEDLSRIITVYEELGKPVTVNLVQQYLQSREIAEDFSAYYDLYNKYKNLYRIEGILDGSVRSCDLDIRNASFDERLSIIGLLIDCLNREFRQYASDQDVQREVFALLKNALAADDSAMLFEMRKQKQEELEREEAAKLISRQDAGIRRKVILQLMEYEMAAEEANASGGSAVKPVGRSAVDPAGGSAAESVIRHASGLDWKTQVRSIFKEKETERRNRAGAAGVHLTNAFSFLAETFGEGQEMVLFLTELSAGYYSLRYVSECGNDAYYRYNGLLLLKERKAALRREILDLTEGL